MLGRDDACGDVIAEFFLKHVHYRRERLAAVVAFKVLDVFQ